MLAIVPVTAKVRRRDVSDGVTATSHARARWAAIFLSETLQL